MPRNIVSETNKQQVASLRLLLLEDESQLGKSGESATRRSGKTFHELRGGIGFLSRSGRKKHDDGKKYSAVSSVESSHKDR